MRSVLIREADQTLTLRPLTAAGQGQVGQEAACTAALPTQSAGTARMRMPPPGALGFALHELHHGSSECSVELLIIEVSEGLPRQRNARMWEGQAHDSMALHSPQKGCRARVRTLEDPVTVLLFSKCTLLLTAFYFTFLFHVCINLIILTSWGGGPVAYRILCLQPLPSALQAWRNHWPRAESVNTAPSHQAARDDSLLLAVHPEHLKLGFGAQMLTSDQYLLNFIHSDPVHLFSLASFFKKKLYYF